MSTKTSTEGIQNNYIQTGGANTKIIVDGTDAVGSFVTRSTVPWNIAVPPDGPDVQILADVGVAFHVEMKRSVVDSTGIIHRKMKKKKKNAFAQVLLLCKMRAKPWRTCRATTLQ